MKAKLIQIALGAVGSIIGVLVQYYANAPADTAIVIAAGSVTALGSDVVTRAVHAVTST